MSSNARTTWRNHPGLEPLETRQLLNGDNLIGFDGEEINLQDLERLTLQKRNGVPLEFRRMTYRTADGATVLITLYGAGTLQGTNLNPSGDLNLVYDRTNGSSRIDAQIFGGTARLASVRDADADIDALSGVGANQVGLVNLRRFDLIPGGKINLTGGASTLWLNSVAAGASIHLRSLPVSLDAGTFSPVGSGEGVQYRANPNGGVEVAQVGLAATSSGSIAATGTTATTGGFGAAAATDGEEVRPEGIALNIETIRGAPASGQADLLPSQVFAYDAQRHVVIRFDTGTGNPLQEISLNGLGPLTGGVTIARANGRLLALASDGAQVRAFDPVGGASVGSFSLSSLGLASVDGIGASESSVILTNSQGGANGSGVAQAIDLARSLETGQAVASGSSFSPGRAFNLNGGAAGVTGLNMIYAVGSGFFDPLDPNSRKLGLLTLGSSDVGGQLRESTRTAIGGARFLNPAATGTEALGSIEGSLALITGVGEDRETGARFNTATLVNPRTAATEGTIRLNYPTRLTGLSESFHPELTGSALIDVRGNVRDFRAGRVEGLVMNVNGALDRIVAGPVSNSVVSARPINHIRIHQRGPNVRLISTDREVGTRNGVRIPENNRPLGPLAILNR